jgi:alpha-beta hydrolase superfamily lysophospholipase
MRRSRLGCGGSVVANQAVPATQSVRAAPLVFGAEARPLFGFYHPAEGPTARGMGVVLCNPLGYEAMCAHSAYRHLAERLAARGYPALRFDYQGTGDSSGRPQDKDRVAAWLASIDEAIDELRRRAGVGAIALVGTRFGATLAAVAGARRGDVQALVLWAPSASGKAYVRELRAFRLIKQPLRVAATPRSDGAEEVAGYVFEKATLSDLSAIDLRATKERVAARVLIVPRDDLPAAEESLAKALGDAGASVRVALEPGYERMMRDPQDTVVPIGTFDKMIDWLDEADYPGARAVIAGPASTSMTTLAATTNAVVRERSIQFGPAGRLFGILSEPGDGSAHPARPAIVLLNVGANHRVGPNRMYVALARDLASLGYVSLRFDVSGLGDSAGGPGSLGARLYSKDSVGDVKTAMSLVTELCGQKRFVLVGLCSGAYLAFHTCVEDPRVVGQVLLNPQTFEWREGDTLDLSMRKSFLSTRYYLRALFEPHVWKRGLRGQLNVLGIAGILRERLAVRVKIAVDAVRARALGQNRQQTEIERAFRATTDRGVESLLVFSFNDGGIDMIEKHLGPDARTMHGSRRFRFEIVDGADHTFTPIDSQTVLHDLLIRHIVERFP